MKITLRILSSFVALFAFIILARLLLVDLRDGFRPTDLEQRASSFALIFIGASYILLQLGSGAKLRELLKGVFLGVAFVLWGAEHFVPAGRPTEAVNFLVVAIFVIDLGLIIRVQLAAAPRPTERT